MGAAENNINTTAEEQMNKIKQWIRNHFKIFESLTAYTFGIEILHYIEGSTHIIINLGKYGVEISINVNRGA
jgi:hypothetical protein